MYLTLGLVMLFGLGTALLTCLGAGTTPIPIRPVAACLVSSRRSSLWLNRVLWALFILVAGAFFTPILLDLYRSAIALGTGR